MIHTFAFLIFNLAYNILSIQETKYWDHGSAGLINGIKTIN